MAELFISIKEAAQLSGKSVQTIRRAIKNKKLSCKKKKTPQGFNYLVKKSSLVKVYGLEVGDDIKSTVKDVSTDLATMSDLKKVQADLENLVREHKKIEKTFVRFMQSLQDKFVALEHQFKALEEPKVEKKWYEFWK